MGLTAGAAPSIVGLVRAISAGDAEAATELLNATPLLPFARLERVEECFVAECGSQRYAGDTALHGVALALDVGFARRLVEAGADVRARNRRGVRNRCAAAVEALLLAGADPSMANKSGSTALDLARWTTGRGGTGSSESRAEQRRLIELLEPPRRNTR